MTPVVLAGMAAVLFGAMTVFVRIALGSGVAPEVGTFFTILPAWVVTVVFLASQGAWDLRDAWPFALAGLLAPGLAQILFTFAGRDAGASSRTGRLVLSRVAFGRSFLRGHFLCLVESLLPLG